ncbi:MULTISPECIES: TetR/AcrR family transcriptional regulator [Pseudoalteromonas]|uniref:TetR family transcriptional regulator n=1 Tax=Pseudoalteromonas fuliginea TaxID=1872678 RepID=A0A063KUE4_9GAMM|nr:MULTISPECIES: TetR/AcrR family transcriptional regulator [Pseudoalteromonas]ALQ09891.1 TetR family transcriptional regulator [Pseudoalteromonas sp. Bsw20308]ATG79537.1 TetR family transcriptional regulator [Pseudoalteromonas sp. 1_2015MBL_MicDiv]KAA1156204.1 TetR/AcrR family transcriptional regulator [Pseudoalteromonas fuliginea]KAA1162595.1 TetR/AcrR family transcriptional regulator [Pseudoalteromonas fuliginea]KAA1167393.1 TetR/AcrR family transcriptional regulator [Pseudoalteromonas fuli
MVNKVKFERENVVRVASQLFWEKGFHATSTRDLQEAVNMRPGSIYSAFGSKEGLYSESLKDYTVQMKSQIDGFLSSSDTTLGGLRAFVENVVIKNKDCSPSAICMLVKANNEFADKNSSLYELSLDLAAKFEGYLTVLFEQAIAKNELSDKLTAIEYARFFQIQFTGLRGYFNRPGVELLAQPMINQMFALMKNL